MLLLAPSLRKATRCGSHLISLLWVWRHNAWSTCLSFVNVAAWQGSQASSRCMVGLAVGHLLSLTIIIACAGIVAALVCM